MRCTEIFEADTILIPEEPYIFLSQLSDARSSPKCSVNLLPLIEMENAKHILVTGGAGYIGSHTVVELIANNCVPVIVDDFRNSEEDIIPRLEEITGEKLEYHNVDVTNYNGMDELFQQYQFEGIIHFAAYKAVGESVEQPLMYYRNNIGGLVTILELAEKNKVSNFVFSSSCTVYGQPEGNLVVTEETPQQRANSPYGATKQMGERILSDVVAGSESLKALHLRYFNPVGAHTSGLIGELPQGRPNNLLPYVTQTGAGVLKELTVFGDNYDTEDGTCIRDYIHVMDLADAHIKGLLWLFEQSGPLEEVVNIGTGKGTSVLEIIHTFEEVSGKKLNWKFGERRQGDVEKIYANATKAKELIGWQASKTIEDAVRDAWNWEQKWRNE